MKKIIPKDAVLIPDNAKRVFQGQIYDVYQWPQKMYDGSTATFEMLKRPDTVAAICIVDGKILVLRDEQPHRGTKLTFPGGRADENNETADEAVKREVAEETGYSFENWRLVDVQQLHGKIEWFIFTYVAWSVSKADRPRPDRGEILSLKQLPFADVKKLASQKAGYLGESNKIFDKVSRLEELIDLPEFQGQTVDRN